MTSTLSPEADASERRRFTFGGVLAIVVVVALIGFWVYAFSPLAPSTKADALNDKTFVDVANARCEASLSELDALPRANSAGTPQERAVVVDRANDIVEAMVVGLRTDAAGATGRDRSLLDRWLTDWDAYLGSRVNYADELRTGAGAVFVVPARSGGQITETMDGFSRTNRIMECLVPLDV